MNRFKWSLFGIVCVSVVTSSYAVDHHCQNQISMQLQQEGWVTSKTASVTVGIQAATSKDDSAKLMVQITDKLKSIVKNSAPWRLVDLSTTKNSAGLLAIAAKMSSRLNNDQIAQLQSAIDTLNKAGEQYKIEGIDYQPQLTEIADENTRLRVLLYKDVLAQEGMINAAFTGAHYQLQTINFESPYVATIRPMMMVAGNGMGAERQAASASATPFSQQLILTANVTFSSPNTTCEKPVK